jgi:hypothetical protein
VAESDAAAGAGDGDGDGEAATEDAGAADESGPVVVALELS